jgi:hypothetical protein
VDCAKESADALLLFISQEESAGDTRALVEEAEAQYNT